MTITKTDIVGKIRTAIDDIVPAAADSFTNDTDKELWQATYHAVQSLLEELPLRLLLPKASSASAVATSDGGSTITLDSDFLKFVEVRLNTWKGTLSELMDPDSEEARRQRSPWSRGTAEKPKAMLDYSASGALTLYCWPTGTRTILNYIPKASKNVADTEISCAIRDEAERYIIYRAASIFFEGKKETDLASKFAALTVTT